MVLFYTPGMIKNISVYSIAEFYLFLLIHTLNKQGLKK